MNINPINQSPKMEAPKKVSGSIRKNPSASTSGMKSRSQAKPQSERRSRLQKAPMSTGQTR